MRRLAVFLMILAFGRSAVAQLSSVTVHDLRYEYLTNPSGQDEIAPRFSWNLQATSPKQFGQKQTAYRILVGSSALVIKTNQGDVWDTGWIRSDDIDRKSVV